MLAGFLACLMGNALHGAHGMECSCQTVEPRVRRVVGGTILNDQQAMPWMTALLDTKGGLVGGATILNQRFLLTAAHVCNGSVPEELTVVAGTNRIHQGRTQVHSPELNKVARCFEHPDFSTISGVNDIAILELQTPLTFSIYIGPACLSSTSGDNIVFVSGWGKTDENGPSTSEDLRVAKLVKASLVQCQAEFGPEAVHPAQIVCAIGNRKDACQGDSGGPLLENRIDKGIWTQLGIVSWGFGCGRPDTPGIYTRVDHYMTWISTIVKDFCAIAQPLDLAENVIDGVV
ncbi:plasma kallikrein-like [Tropilaelaps mercedesae]|uniref:Plasma kallikrein-like n=1 Tax=Tropilaelaps mercedesae TaxID=418985 RepID=A0A1V9XAR7_9ACAR|nr:plasma kallikrein-like [Tropilaelaps mercedesae]